MNESASSIEPPASARRERATVRTYHVDMRGNLTIGALLGFLQEAAGNHAEALGVGMDRLLEEKIAWMLHRLQLNLLRLPRLHDELEIITWPTGFRRAFASRDFQIRANGDILLRGSSTWVIASMEARRAVRIPQWVQDIPVDSTDSQIAAGPRKLGDVEIPDESRTFHVRRADLDRVGHVNNCRYAEWVVETVSEDAHTSKALSGLDIIFRAESVYGDTIESVSGGSTNEGFVHALRRTRDGQELVQARTTWR